jgi:hypothetical protein
MWLIKNHKTGKYYKTTLRIHDDKLRSLHSFPFVKAGAMTEDESRSDVKCLDKWPFIEIVTQFDGRRYTWMRDCDWFTWLVVLEEN